MRTNDLLSLSTRAFKTNKARTWLTILGMGVGTAAVVMLVGLGFGLQNILLEQIVFGDTLLSLRVTNPSSRTVVLDQETVESFLEINQVSDIAPQASVSSLVTMGDLTGNALLQGVGENYFSYAGVKFAEGNPFGRNDREVVLLSSGALKLFDIEPTEALGKRVTFRASVPNPNGGPAQEISIPTEYEVTGIVDNPTAIIAMIPLEEFNTHFEVPSYEVVQVKVSDREFLNTVTDTLIELGFQVTSLSKTVEQANKIFQGFQGMMAIFGGIALVVSAIGMFNTMTVTLLERTKEIGIMRTLGGAPKDIKTLFIVESVIIGFLGGVVGMGIGIIIGLVINAALNAIAGQFGGVSVSLFKFPLGFLIFITVFSAVVGYLTGIFPAKRAGSINPLDAIRYE